MRRILDSIEFLRRHRKSENDCMRKRKLPLSRMILLGLTRSLESLQSRLNEAQRVLQRVLTVEPSVPAPIVKRGQS